MAVTSEVSERISIHALLAESDISVLWMALSRPLFLSTLSLRRATLSFYAQNRHLTFLSTLSLRRATPSIQVQHPQKVFLSTLSLRRATCKIYQQTCSKSFLSTLSLRRATDAIRINQIRTIISIHALLAESDALRQLQSALR